MKSLRKYIALLMAAAMMLVTVSKVEAAEYVTDCGGCGYNECRKCPSIAPAVALGTIALVAIIAVALQNQSNSHSHNH